LPDDSHILSGCLSCADFGRAKSPSSAQKSPSGCQAESASADFHELRQGFIPPDAASADKRGFWDYTASRPKTPVCLTIICLAKISAG
jgi:hypothetical protein